jgi:hypothetical protein
LLDLAGERRLRDVQPFRGPREVPFVGQGDEIAKVTKFHDYTC